MNIKHQFPTFLYSVVFWLLPRLALFSFVFNQFIFISSAQALPITADGTTNTHVTQTRSGIDQINIATPDEHGLSHNKFIDYNSNPAGQEINNFSGGITDAVQTQIGGLVLANPNLEHSGSARIILNEVTSTNVSQLLGYIEIAGTQAELIIANPNGIVCLGCGFINTSRLSIIAGSSDFDQNGNLGFDLSQSKINEDNKSLIPLITISGLGLDAHNTSATDIISSSIKLISSFTETTPLIFGSDDTDVTLKTGEGRYDYNSKNITDNGLPTAITNPELFAIDANNFGSIQSGRIFIIATKAGFGVNFDNSLIATKELNIDTAGNLYYGDISSKNSAIVKSAANIESINANSQIAALNLTIHADKELKNSGYIYGKNFLSINVADLTNYSSGSIFSPQSYEIILSGALTNSGLISSSKDLTIWANKLINNSAAEISASNDLRFTITNSISNSGNLIADNNINFEANSFANSGAVQGLKGATFNFVTFTNSENASIYSGQNLDLKVDSSLNNLGKISAVGNLTIRGKSAITNLGNILSNGDLIISGDSLNNEASGVISALHSFLRLTLASDSKNDGEISASGNLTISDANANSEAANLKLTNNGNIASDKNLTFTINDLQNFGTIYSGGALSITAATLNNLDAALMFSTQDISIKSVTDFKNSAKIQATTTLTFDKLKNFTNSGKIISGDNLKITLSGNLTNEKNSLLYATKVLTIQSAIDPLAENPTINPSSILKNSGEISAIDSATINFASIINFSNIRANNSLTIKATSIDNNGGAIIASINDSLTLDIADYLKNSGTIFAKVNLTLSDKSTLNLLDNSGDISFYKLDNQLSELKIKDFTNSGNISSNQDFTLTTANKFDNSGNISSQNNFTINSHNIFTNSGIILAAKTLTLNADSLSNEGEISAVGDSKITVVGAITNANKILAKGSLTIAADNITNNSGAVMASLASFLKITLATELQNYGEISALGNVEISDVNLAPKILHLKLTNYGNIISGKDLKLTSDELNNKAAGNIQSGKDSIIKTSTLDNFGTIRSLAKATINSTSLTNENGALIFTTADSQITATDIFTNSGSILARAKLDLTLGSATNESEIFSVGDLQFTTHDLTNRGSISSVGKLDITNSASIDNYSEIFSNGNLTIKTNSLHNFADGDIETGLVIDENHITYYGNLTLDLSGLTNDGKIISAGTFEIKATGNVANNALLQSADSFDITANILNNNTANSLIFSAKNLTINAGSVDNSGNQPKANLIAAGIISDVGTITINANSLNNNHGLVKSKGRKDDLNIAETFLSSAAVIFNLGNSDYDITGTVEAADYVDITAHNINNYGNISSNGYIKLHANNGGFVNNGYAPTKDEDGNNIYDKKNDNVKLVAASYLEIIADEEINNYGIISVNNNLTLTSRNSDINNYGQITGGVGGTELNADNGDINNFVVKGFESKITADNALFLNAININNDANISVRNDLTVNATNLNNNESALIWSGRDSLFYVTNNFINNQAEIFAMRNLTIQKSSSVDPALNKTSYIKNYAGKITAYNGDLTIKADDLENITEPVILTYAGKWDRWHGDNPPYYVQSTYYYTDLTSQETAQIFAGKNMDIAANSITNEASIIASVGNMKIDFRDELNNDAFHARWNDKHDQEIEYAIVNWGQHDIRWSHFQHEKYFDSIIKSGRSLTLTSNGVNKANLINRNESKNVIDDYSTIALPYKNSQLTLFNKIDILTLKDTGVVNIDLSNISKIIRDNDASKKAADADIATTESSDSPSSPEAKTVSKDDVNNPASGTTFTPSSLAAHSSDTIFSGSYKINLGDNPNKPLIEARSEFTDFSQFFGSAYYFTQLGVDGNQFLNQLDQIMKMSVRMLGDSYVESMLMKNTLITLTNDSFYLSKSETDFEQEIKNMINNSVDEMHRLGLSATDVAMKGLSKAQANSLQKDIVTFELTKVSGVEVLAPKIYLSEATRERLFGDGSSAGAFATNATIFAKENLTINAPAANLMNSGSITSGNNLNINVASLTNKTISIPAQIKSANDLTITVNTGDIKNIGANISATGSVNLTALQGNILSSTLVKTNDINLLNANPDSYIAGAGVGNHRSISSSLYSNAKIEGGEININAANDFTNLAAAIVTNKNTTTSGNLTIAAGDDINIGTLQLHQHSETSWGSKKKGGTTITDSVENIGSDIFVGGSLEILASGTTLAPTSEIGNINIKGSNITTEDNLTLTAKNDINITSAQDSSYRFAAGRTGRGKSYLDESSSTTQISSNLVTNNNGDIIINSGVENIDIVGSLGAAGSINLIASNLKTSDVDGNATNNFGSGNILLAAKENLTISSALNSKFEEHSASKKGMTVKKSSIDIFNSETNVSSSVDANGDFSSTSGSDTNIIASNLSGRGDGTIIAGTYLDSNPLSPTYNTMLSNSNAKVNIYDAVDTTSSYQNTVKERAGIFTQIPLISTGFALINYAFTGFGYRVTNAATGGGYEQTATYSKSNVDGLTTTQKVISSNLNFNNDLSVATTNDLNIRSSNLKTEVGNISLSSGSDLNIIADIENNSVSRFANGKASRSTAKENLDLNESTAISSNIISGNNLTLSSVNDTTLQAAKLTSGTSGTAGSQDLTVNAGNNLLILSTQHTATKSESNKNKGTFSFSNGTSGYVVTDITNTEIRSDGVLNGTGAGATSGAINLSAGNIIVAQYNSGSGEALAPNQSAAQGLNDTTLSRDFSNSPQLSYLNNLNPSQVIYNPMDETHIDWDQTTRGLTQTGTAVVAIAVIAATGGSGVVAVMGSAAAATASVSAVNASMNADGNIWNQGSFVLDSSYKATTSNDSLRNIAIAGATAGLTSWASEAAGIKDAAAAAKAAQAANTTSKTEQFIQSAKIALAQSAISNVSSVAVQSAINGDSFEDALKRQAVNIVIGAVGNVAAQGIGNAAHSGTIGQPLQLTLHAVLGCGVGSSTGGDCASGAAAGVVGELAGESLKDYASQGAEQRANAIKLSGLAGSGGALAASLITGSSDEQTASNIFAGQRIGGNAAENNALKVKVQPVRLGYYHTSTTHEVEPGEEKFFETDPRYLKDPETGKLYMTLGGGPDNASYTSLGNLIGDINRKYDVLTNNKIYSSSNLISPESEIYIASKLYWNNRAYQDNLPYELFPTQNSKGYNSNSLTAGLLNSVGVTPPILPKYISYPTPWQDLEYPERSPKIFYPVPMPTPGYDKPVPPQFFGVQ